MSEAGFYKQNESNHSDIYGPSQAPGGGMSVVNHTLIGPFPSYHGWSWQDDGENGAGFYNADGSYRDGIYVSGQPVYDHIVPWELNNIDKIGWNGWQWFETKTEAYAFYDVPMPPEQWTRNTAYDVGVNVYTDCVYICTQAGTSDEWSQGPQMWMGDTGIMDGTVLWDAVVA